MKRTPRAKAQKKPEIIEENEDDAESKPQRKRIMRAATRISGTDGKRLRRWKRKLAEYSGEDGDECHLLRVPDEIVLHIVGYMDNPHVLAMTCQRMHDTFALLKQKKTLPQYGFNPFACLPAAVRRGQPATTFYIGRGGLSLHELVRGVDNHFVASVYGKSHFSFIGSFGQHFLPSTNRGHGTKPRAFEMNGSQYFVIDGRGLVYSYCSVLCYSPERNIIDNASYDWMWGKRVLGGVGNGRLAYVHEMGLGVYLVDDDFDHARQDWFIEWRYLNTFRRASWTIRESIIPETCAVARDNSCIAMLFCYDDVNRVMLVRADGKYFKILTPERYALPVLFTWEWSLCHPMYNSNYSLTLVKHGDDTEQALPFKRAEGDPDARPPVGLANMRLVQMQYLGKPVYYVAAWHADARGLLFAALNSNPGVKNGVYIGAYNMYTNKVLFFRRVAEETESFPSLTTHPGGFSMCPLGKKTKTLFYY